MVQKSKVLCKENGICSGCQKSTHDNLHSNSLQTNASCLKILSTYPFLMNICRVYKLHSLKLLLTKYVTVLFLWSCYGTINADIGFVFNTHLISEWYEFVIIMNVFTANGVKQFGIELAYMYQWILINQQDTFSLSKYFLTYMYQT